MTRTPTTASSLQDLIRRHSAFWRRDPVDEPLLSVRPGPATWPPRPWPLAGRGWAHDPVRILPDDIDLDRMIGFHSGEEALLRGELFNTVAPVFPQAWMGALVGCPIYASAFGCVARPTGEDIDAVLARFSLESAMTSPWLGVMDRMIERAVLIAGGRYPVEQLHLRGVVDMLAAVFGEARFCMLLYDRPEEVRELAGRFADLIIAVATRGLDRRSPWGGGYLHRWGILAPGPMHDYQADASTILSPQLYEGTLMEFDRKVLAGFEYSMIHLHAAGLHMVEPLLKIPELDAIQVNLDRETGVLEKSRILEIARTIQAAGKGLLLCGELTEAELDEFRAALEPAGLAMDCLIIPEA